MRILSFFFIAAVGCGGTTTSNGASSSPLTGTWDVTSSFTGRPATERKGTITLGPNDLVFDWPNRKLAFHRSGDAMSLHWTTELRSNDINVVRTPGVVDLGALPLDVGGKWVFDNPKSPIGRCEADASPAAFIGSCDGVYPEQPIPQVNGAASGKRTEKRDSIFGDLGGVWELTTTRGVACAAVFEASSATLSCGRAANAFSGTLKITFAGDTASGTTSRGVEFAARRR